MTETSDPDDGAAADAARDLTELNAQVEAARVMLKRLQQEMSEAESHLTIIPTVELLEANEKLVVNALRAQTEVETAVRALKEVSRSAELDPLTQLPNRALVLDRLAHSIATAKRHRGRFALLFLDVNDFKRINDTFGHGVGDEVLKLFGHCLSSSVREADTVSRYGGDEFLMLLTEVCQASDAFLVAAKVMAALGTPNRIGDHVFQLTASIGISIYPDDGADAATLIDQADAAMYRAKRHGPDSYAFHGEEPMNERSFEPRALNSRQQPMNGYAQALAERERGHAQLREANERLILSALRSQEMLEAAEQAQLTTARND
jgi:diguanylate cyclase